MKFTASESFQQSRPLDVTPKARITRRLNLARLTLGRDLLLLLFSSAISEVACNVVYIVIIERAFVLGEGPVSVGIVMIIQSTAQIFFGSWTGGIADQLGFKRTAVFAILAIVVLVFSLTIVKVVLFIYIIAFLLMLGRLLLIPARLGLIAQVTDRDRLMEANTSLSILSGVGSFIGPAIAGMLLLASDDFGTALRVASGGWLLSLLPLTMIRMGPGNPISLRRTFPLEEIRNGWHLIRRRNTIKQVLWCLIVATLLLGAVSPLFTSLSRHFGLGSEGTGVFFSALGFGTLIGPLIATGLTKWLRVSSTLLIMGLLAPIGLVIVGMLNNLQGVLIAIAVAATAGAGLNVIVTTVTQRLSRPGNQGSVLGTEQSLLGIAGILPLAAITGLTALWDIGSNVQVLFLALGSSGFVAILTCWILNQQTIQKTCDLCEPDLRFASVACRILRSAPFRFSDSLCSILCGYECQSCFSQEKAANNG
ncbi:MAG TPA: MFS transporter [Anaerolineales bacterium]|nr:MFS transporter [Anaerolineales bacterium]